jgi:hypothetical protein
MRKSFVSELHGEWSEFADEDIGLWQQLTQVFAPCREPVGRC